MRYMVQAFCFAKNREGSVKELAEFTIGFMTVWRIVLLAAGGVSAVLVFLLAVVTAALILGSIFDSCTGAMAKHWIKTGHQPKNRLGRIILENHKRLGA